MVELAGRCLCGSVTPLSYESGPRPGETGYYVMLLDGPGPIPVKQHDHCNERVDWLSVVDDLPKHEEQEWELKSPRLKTRAAPFTTQSSK